MAHAQLAWTEFQPKAIGSIKFVAKIVPCWQSSSAQRFRCPLHFSLQFIHSIHAMNIRIWTSGKKKNFYNLSNNSSKQRTPIHEWSQCTEVAPLDLRITWASVKNMEIIPQTFRLTLVGNIPCLPYKILYFIRDHYKPHWCRTEFSN